MTFRDDVLAYLQRDEYPFLGATTDDLPKGVGVSFWDDNAQSMVWMTIIESPDPEAGEQACEQLYNAGIEAYERTDPTEWNTYGVICIPKFTWQYDEIAQSVDFYMHELWTFDVVNGLVPVPYANEDEDATPDDPTVTELAEMLAEVTTPILDDVILHGTDSLPDDVRTVFESVYSKAESDGKNNWVGIDSTSDAHEAWMRTAKTLAENPPTLPCVTIELPGMDDESLIEYQQRLKRMSIDELDAETQSLEQAIDMLRRRQGEVDVLPQLKDEDDELSTL